MIIIIIKERSVAFKIRQNSFPAIPHPIGTDPPSAFVMRPPRIPERSTPMIAWLDAFTIRAESKRSSSPHVRITRSPYNLRPTTRKCVHLVTRGHSRSGDKDGGHIIWSAVSENPMLHANFTALWFIEPELLPIKRLVLFCSCDHDLDPMTFIYELDPYSRELYRMCENELPSQWFRKLSFDRHK